MPDTGQEEEKLLKLAQSGQVEAFGALYELHVERVYHYLLIRLGNSQDAEDLTTEVFLKAWKALPKFRHLGVPFSAYLLRIARNTAIDQARRRPPPVSLEQTSEPVDHRPDLLDRLVQKQEEYTMNHALNSLNDDYQKILILRFIEGLSLQETAGALGRSVGAVRVLQHRALKALNKRLSARKQE